MKLLFAAGTWDEMTGKKSGLLEKIYLLIKEKNIYDIDYYNGGNYNKLKEITNTAANYDIIIWMANIPSHLPLLTSVKSINPKALVVGSKRNHYNEYSFVEILNKSLERRYNLTIEFSKNIANNIAAPYNVSQCFKMLLFDPLGTAWYDGYNINELVEILLKRITFILSTRREPTHYLSDSKIFIPNDESFFKYVRDVAEIFHQTINHADGVTRFLGNASFRGPDDLIFISRRDVDKALINRDTFVQCCLKDEKVYYYGPYKPSKDTVIQTRLYKKYKNINYIIHSHCYVDSAAITEIPVPCGALDEVDEINKAIKNYYNNDNNLNCYKINLIGHGCIIMGNSINDLTNTKYITRNLPEYLKQEEI